MSSSTRPPRHVLRGLLRRLQTPPLPAKLSAKQQHRRLNPAQQYVLEQYRGGGSATALSSNYLQLLQDLHERATLYQLDTGAEQVLSPAESSRRAAARAGLQLPETAASR